MGEGLVLADSSRRLRLINRAGQEILGIGVMDAPERQWSSLYKVYLPDGLTPYPVAELPLVRALDGAEVDDAELCIRPTKGVRRYLNCVARPVRDGHGVQTGAVAVFRDVTLQRRAEDILRVQHAATLILSETRTLAEAAGPLLEAIGGYLHRELGELWEVDAWSDVLRADRRLASSRSGPRELRRGRARARVRARRRAARPRLEDGGARLRPRRRRRRPAPRGGCAARVRDRAGLPDRERQRARGRDRVLEPRGGGARGRPAGGARRHRRAGRAVRGPAALRGRAAGLRRAHAARLPAHAVPGGDLRRRHPALPRGERRRGREVRLVARGVPEHDAAGDLSAGRPPAARPGAGDRAAHVREDGGVAHGRARTARSSTPRSARSTWRSTAGPRAACSRRT